MLLIFLYDRHAAEMQSRYVPLRRIRIHTNFEMRRTMKNLISIVLLLLVANISTAQQVISIPGEQSVVNIPSNGDTMFGTMFTAEGPGPHPTILILHGSPGGSVLGAGAISGAGGLTLPLQSAGFNALIFNYRGAWGSGGKYSIKGRNEDVHAASSVRLS